MEQLKKIIIAIAVATGAIGVILIATAFIGEISVPRLVIGVFFILAGIAAYVSGTAHISKK